MTKGSPNHDDEIDLYDFFETLWNGKRKILLTTFFVSLLGVVIGFVKSNSFQVSTYLYSGSQSVFLPYTSINNILKDKGLLYSEKFNPSGYILDDRAILKMFVQEFNDYEEMVDVLKQSNFVKQSISGLNEVQKQREVIDFAKSFMILPPTKTEPNWILKFEWHDDLEGIKLFTDAINKTLVKIRNTTKNNIIELANSLAYGNKLKLEKLQNDLNIIIKNQNVRNQSRIQFLNEQLVIANELGIVTDSNVELNLQRYNAYYLRGSKAIKKEIEIIKNRKNKKLFLMSDKYLDVSERILSVQNDLSSSQLRSAAKLIGSDIPYDWVNFKLGIGDIKSKINMKIFILISLIIGSILGCVYVIISNAITKRKDKFK